MVLTGKDQRLNVVFNDSGDVPDAVIGPDGRVYAYFQGLWTPYTDGIMVGISADGISNWEFHQIRIPGTDTWPGRPCDPDVIVRNDTFRLYFTGDPINDMRPETYSAISLNGINFTLEPGVRFEIPGSPVLDPSLLWTDGLRGYPSNSPVLRNLSFGDSKGQDPFDTLRYFAGGAPPGENWHAYSVDGLNFIRQANFFADSCMMANGIRLPQGGYRFYIFSNNPNRAGIRSIYSPDGRNWTVDSGYRLQLDTTNGLESRYVKDPAIVFKDSVYLMYYVTRKPQSAIFEPLRYRGDNEIRILPNPCHKILWIYTTNFLSNLRLRLWDVTGREIKILQIKGPVTKFDLSDLPDGVYFIAIDFSPKILQKFVYRH